VIWTWKKLLSKANQAYNLSLYPLPCSIVEVTTHKMRQGLIALDPAMVQPSFGRQANFGALSAMWRCIRRGHAPESWGEIDPHDVHTILCGAGPIAPPPSQPTLDFWWYHGSTGTGKSRAAREMNPGYYLKELNRWWDGYDGHDCVLIEEFHPGVAEEIKQKMVSS
jgi:hypothetical protein